MPAEAPHTVKGYLGTVEFDGRTVTVSKTLRGETRIPVRNIAEIELGNAGIGMAYIRFATGGTGRASRAGKAMKSHHDVASDPEVLTFRRSRRDEFRALRAEVEVAIAALGQGQS
jgi:hypothetical protein